MNKDFRCDNVALLFTSSRKLDNIQSGLKDCMLVGSEGTSWPRSERWMGIKEESFTTSGGRGVLFW